MPRSAAGACVLAAGSGAGGGSGGLCHGRRNCCRDPWAVAGWLGDAVSADRRLIACASYAVQVIGSLLFILAAGDGGPWLFLGIALFGLGIGNATSLPPLIAQQEFPPAETARVVPLIVAIGQAGYAFAPAAFGLLRGSEGGDATGSASLFLCAAAIQLAAIGCFLAGR